jgi:hypothetical protein
MHNLFMMLFYFMIFLIAAIIIARISTITLGPLISKTPHGWLWMFYFAEWVLDIARVYLFYLLIVWMKTIIHVDFLVFYYFLMLQILSFSLIGFENTFNKKAAKTELEELTQLHPQILKPRMASILFGIMKKASKMEDRLQKTNLQVNILGYLTIALLLYK